MLPEVELWVRVVTAAVGCALAALVYVGAPGRSVHRWLAAFLGVDALNTLFAALVVGNRSQLLELLPNEDGMALGFTAVSQLTWFALVLLYVGFLARAAPSPATAWLRYPRVRAVWPWFVVTVPWLWFIVREPYARLVAREQTGALLIALVEVVPMLAAATLGIVAMVQWVGRNEPGTLARVRATRMLITFGVATIAWVWILVDFALYYVVPDLFANEYWSWRGIGFHVLVFSHYVLLSWSMLRGQLLDIDRRRIRQAAVGGAGLFCAIVFFVASEQVESVAGLAGTTSDLVVAAIVSMVFWPLQWLARTGLMHLMGGSQHGATSSAGIFLDQFRIAMDDEVIETAEQAQLTRLADDLQLTPEQVAKLESIVRGSLHR